MNDQCPDYCKCLMANVVVEPETNALDPMIEVNCTNKSLTEFPSRLPEYTKTVILNRNEISDLKTLIKNNNYKYVLEVYLNYNKIKTIDCLEGSYFLSRFRILSLIGNQISQVFNFESYNNNFKLKPISATYVCFR